MALHLKFQFASALCDKECICISVAANSCPAVLVYLNFAQMPYTLHKKQTPDGNAVST